LEGGDEAVDDVAVFVVVFGRVGEDREESAGEEVVGAGVVRIAAGEEACGEVEDLYDGIVAF